jgi:FdhD protein
MNLAERLPGVSVPKPIERFGPHGFRQELDRVAEEVPVALHYNDQPYAVMLASPSDLEDFALGFSLTENIINSREELAQISVREELSGVQVLMQIPAARAAKLAPNTRTLAGNSGCGLCGTRQLEDVVRWPPAVAETPTPIGSAAINQALAALPAHQPLYRITGATHAAAWCLPNGELALVREDVGRHNALDKLMGAMARDAQSTANGALLLTSRASYEMVQKAAWCGVSMIVAVSAPTALAIAIAEHAQITLIGLARDGRYVAYTHPSRLHDYAAPSE